MSLICLLSIILFSLKITNYKVKVKVKVKVRKQCPLLLKSHQVGRFRQKSNQNQLNWLFMLAFHQIYSSRHQFRNHGTIFPLIKPTKARLEEIRNVFQWLAKNSVFEKFFFSGKRAWHKYNYLMQKVKICTYQLL